MLLFVFGFFFLYLGRVFDESAISGNGKPQNKFFFFITPRTRYIVAM